MSTVAELNVDILGNVSDLESKMTQATGIVDSAASSLESAGKTVSVGISAPLALVGGLAINAANSINQNLGNVQSLGVAQERVEDFRTAIQEMSIAVGKDTADLGDGLYQVVSAFGDSADTVAILETNAMAAAAGMASTTDAINLTSAVTKGYGDTSADAVKRVADLAFTTVKLGQTTFPELASSMGRVVPLGASMGASMEELFGVMATGTGVTGSAAEVSTQLRGILQSLAAPTGNMSTLFEKWGYESGEAALQSMGLQGVIAGIVQEAESSGLPLQKYISSIEGQTLALALAGPQADVFTEKLAAMESSGGALVDAFEAQTEGINANGFAMQQARQKLNVFLERIGQGLGPIISSVIDVLEPFGDKILALSDWFVSLDESTQKLIGGIGLFLVALGPGLLIAGQFLSVMSGLAPVLGAVAGALGLLVSPIGLVIGGLAVLFAMDFGGFRTKVTEWANNFRENFDSVKNAGRDFKDAIGWIINGEGWNVDWWWDITGAMEEALSLPADSLDGLADTMYEAGGRIGAVIGGLAGGFEVFKQAYSGEFDASTYADAANALEEAFGAGLADTILNVGSALRGVVDAAGALASSEEVAALKTTVTAAFSGLGSDIVSLVSGELSFADFKDRLQMGFGESIGEAIDAVTASEEFATAKTALSGLLDAAGILEPLQSLSTGIQTAFAELQPYIEGPLQNLKDAFATFSTVDFTPITEGFTAVKDAIAGLFEGGEGNGARLLEGLGVIALQLAIEGIAASVETAVTLIQGFIETVGNVLTLLSETISGAQTMISSALGGDLTGTIDGARAILQAFQDFITSMYDNISTTITNIVTIIGDLVGASFEDIGIVLNEPEWLADLLDWIPVTPTWVTDMLDWIPDVPDWVDDLFNFKLKTPDWLDSLLSWAPKLPGWLGGQKQLGTMYSPGEWATVGEAGPELMYIPRGAAILPNRQSEAMMGGAGGVTVNIYGATIRGEQDVWSLANEIDALRRRRA